MGKQVKTLLKQAHKNFIKDYYVKTTKVTEGRRTTYKSVVRKRTF